MENCCSYCDEPTTGFVGFDGPLCTECAHRHIIAILNDCDEADLTTLRRRAEDCLRKNPSALQDVLAGLITKQLIVWEDCV